MTSSLVALRASGASLYGASRWQWAIFKTFGDAQIAIFGASEHRAIWMHICAFRPIATLASLVILAKLQVFCRDWKFGVCGFGVALAQVQMHLSCSKLRIGKCTARHDLQHQKAIITNFTSRSK